jgi:dipeptidyl-peptidase-4
MPSSLGRLAAAGLVVACFANPTMADELTIDRLFAAPDLSGASLRGLRFSPDNGRVTWLQGAADDKDRLDLWEYDLKAHATRRLVDSRALAPGDGKLSAEEEARRERQRTASLSGIVDYEFASTGRALLFPLNGDLYYYDLGARSANAVRRLTSTPDAETDPRFSPRARYVSYVRGQDLYAFDLAANVEKRLTTDGGGLVANGVAEFIAQEEMDRSTGYWWSPDEAHVAYARVDETPVAEVERFEIYADDVKVVKQRYPKAGAANALVDLYVLDVATNERLHVDLAGAVPGMPRTTDYYLARVDWFPDGRHLLVQRQTRDQKRLDLLQVDAKTGATRVLLTETAEHWVELHNDLRFLKKRGGFLWVSQRSGFPHVYRYSDDGRLVAQLTGGDWLVVGAPRAIVGVDETRGLVYFTGTKDGYAEKHLYSVSLDAKGPTEPRRLTAEPGWHDVQMANDAQAFLDNHSSVDRPPSVALKDASGRRLAWLVENPLDAKHPYAPYLATHPRFEFGSLPAADGTPLPWMLVKPHGFDASKRYPVVVLVYGGPHGRMVTNAWTGGLANYLARRGFLVFAIENRGASRQGVRADTALHRRMGTVEVEDQVAGANWLKSQPFVDPARIGVYGWSYGGYMTLNLMTRAPGVYAVGVSGAPVTDWSLYDTHYTERYMGTPADNAAGYAQSSVLTHADGLVAPLLIVHGMADDNVLFAHSTKLFAELQKRRKPFDVMVYPGYKHGLTRQASVGPHALGTITRYLEEHLRPGGDSGDRR